MVEDGLVLLPGPVPRVGLAVQLQLVDDHLGEALEPVDVRGRRRLGLGVQDAQRSNPVALRAYQWGAGVKVNPRIPCDPWVIREPVVVHGVRNDRRPRRPQGPRAEACLDPIALVLEACIAKPVGGHDLRLPVCVKGADSHRGLEETGGEV